MFSQVKLTHHFILTTLLVHSTARPQNLLGDLAPIMKISETPHNSTAVPGDSPVKYHHDPSSDLFKIESLDMHPNPCVMYVFRSPSLLEIFLQPYPSKECRV